jgi:NADH-quinone oxidoreductase subunit H
MQRVNSFKFLVQRSGSTACGALLLLLAAPAAHAAEAEAAGNALDRAPLAIKEGILSILANFLPGWLMPIVSATITISTVLALFGVMFALLSLLERKALARMQNRRGPNRVGPCGLFQPLADAVKMLTKEDIVPRAADPVVHFLAPVVILLPAVLALSILPYGRGMTPVELQTGILLFFAVGAAAELAVFMAGWASANKFALLGAMRGIAQILSYELPMILTAAAVVMIAGTLSPSGIVLAQGGYGLGFIPQWFILTPWGILAGFVFFLAAAAESNRTPFDLPEGESEIVAGHMTEYSGFKYAIFFMGEYIGMMAMSGLFVTLFLGGWQAPLPFLQFIPSWAWFFFKLALVVTVLLWFRGTFPRVRSDHLMNLCWKFLVPAGILLVPSAAVWHYTGGGLLGWLIVTPLVFGPVLLWGRAFNRRFNASARVYRFAS